MTTQINPEILKALALNAIDRLEKDKRIICSMPSLMSAVDMEIFYDNKIESIQKFLKALSFTNEVDVELCELLEKEDYLVVAQSFDNEVKAFSEAMTLLHRHLLTTPVDTENTEAENEKMKPYFDQQWAMVEAKHEFYHLYNQVRYN